MYFNVRCSSLQLFSKSISKLTQSATFSLKRFIPLFILTLAFLCSVQSSWGQSIFTNPINGNSIATSTTNWYTANQTFASGITASGIRRGTGTSSSNANDRYNANGWNSGSLNANDYFEWTITPSSCREIDFVSFVYTSQVSNSTIANFAFRSSIDNFAANIGNPDFDGTTISLSASSFQNITSPITFRLYAWGGDDSGRTFSINDFTFNGSVAVLQAHTVSSASSTPTLCINTALTNITHTTTGATGISNSGVSGANGLPAGVSASWASNTITISGTPTASGTFNYSILLTGGCGTVNATGTIVVNDAATAPTSISGTSSICSGMSVSLSAVGGIGSVFQWGTGTVGNNIISGATSSTYTVVPTATTTYWVRRVQQSPCTGFTSEASFTVTVSSDTPTQFPTLADGDYVWRGTTNSNWSTDANWSIYNLNTNSFTNVANDPDNAAVNVFILPISSCNNYGFVIARNCILNSDRDVNNITIVENAQLSIDDTDDLGVFGNWINNGSFIHNDRNAMVDFENATAAQFIGGSSVTEFYRLEISTNNTSNVIASQNIKVKNGFAFAGNRKFELGNNTIEFLGASTISGANNSRYFVTNGNGTVQRTVSNGFVTFPIGVSLYNPCDLSNSGTSDIFSVRVIDNVTQNGTGIGATTPAKCVKRTWMVSESTTGGSNVTMRLQWNGNNAEHANGFAYNPGFMYMAHHNGTIWEDLGFSNQSNAANAHTLTQSNITSFSPFAIADASTPLPVELTSFTAVCEEGKGVNIAWTTASEHNSSHFDVLKSDDGYNWRSIATIAAAGNATNTINYGIVDAEKANGVSYYKLMQYDIDGESKEYGPISSDCYHLGEMVVKTFPNPSGDEFYVELISPEATSTNITIVDAQGKSVYTRTVETEKGTNLYTFEMLNILPGMYYIQISNDLTTPNVVKHSFR